MDTQDAYSKDYEQLTVVDDPNAALLDSETGDVTPKPLTPQEKRISSLQFYCLCSSLFLIGWNDGSTGPLLPRIHDVYNVGFETLSWIFVLSFSGSVVGALLNMPLGDKFGIGKMLVFAAGLQACGFAVQAIGLPFPLFVISFAASGMGVSVQDAQANGFIAMVRHEGEKKMSLLHFAYGVGALVSPLIATQFAQTEHWSLHYGVSFIFAVVNAIMQASIFQFKDQDENLARAGEVIPKKTQEEESTNKYSRLLRLKSVHLLTLFLVVYVGVEVTIGGWIVTIMVFARGGGPSAGYIASGFFGGMAVGRVALIKVNKQIGEIRAIYVYTILSILLQLVVWLVPSLIVNAIAVSFIGVLFGPMYPIAISHTARIIPRELVTGAIGWITASAAGGAAMLPFVTGVVAGRLGVDSLHPLILGMMVVMGGVWAVVPK